MLTRKEHLLDISTCNSLKGLLACMVLLCHLHGRTHIFAVGPLGGILTAFGYLAVSAFFFLSGFGLAESARLKENYIKTFPGKKIFSFFLLCVFTILIYLVRDFLVGNKFDLLLFAQSFTFGYTIVDNGWYLQAQLLFYILFYFVFRFSKKHKLVMFFSAACLYCLLCAALGLTSTWYEAILCFPLGVAYANYKDKVHSIIFKSKLKTIFLFLIFLCAFILLLLFSTKLSFSSLLKITCKMASAIAFVWVATIFVLVININNPITRFLGKISLEIYLLQGIFLNLFKNQIYIENDILYILAVTVCTIILAMLAHPVYKAIGKLHFKKTV